MNEGLLSGKTAVITGANRGLGKAIALALAEAGARVVLAARDLELLNQTAEAVTKIGGQPLVYKTDVTKESDIVELERAVARETRQVQILVNNAGMNIRKPAVEFTLQEWRQVIDTNLTSAFLMCRSFVPLMKGQGYGRILNITSIMSHVSLPGRCAYSAS